MPEEEGPQMRLLVGEKPTCKKDGNALSYAEYVPLLPTYGRPPWHCRIELAIAWNLQEPLCRLSPRTVILEFLGAFVTSRYASLWILRTFGASVPAKRAE